MSRSDEAARARSRALERLLIVGLGVSAQRAARARSEATFRIGEHDLDATILLPTGSRIVARDGQRLAATHRFYAAAIDAVAGERIGHRLRASLRQILVVVI